MKPWTFEINGAGPDWYFDISLDQPAQVLIPSQLLAGYRHYQAVDTIGLITKKIGCHAWFIDTYHYEQFVQIATKNEETPNLWNFACILFEGHQIQIRRGYGFGDETHLNTEMNVLRSPFKHPDLQITSWEISAGGMGYDFVTIAKGNNKLDLKAYLEII